MTEAEVEKRVTEKLRDRGDRGGRSVEVEPGATRIEDDWYYVIVRATRSNGSAQQVVDLLEEIEDELKGELGVEVLILPAKPAD